MTTSLRCDPAFAPGVAPEPVVGSGERVVVADVLGENEDRAGHQPDDQQDDEYQSDEDSPSPTSPRARNGACSELVTNNSDGSSWAVVPSEFLLTAVVPRTVVV